MNPIILLGFTISTYTVLTIILETINILISQSIYRTMIYGISSLNIIISGFLILGLSSRYTIRTIWFTGLNLFFLNLSIKVVSILLFAVVHFDPSPIYVSLSQAAMVLGVITEFLSFIWLYYLLINLKYEGSQEDIS